MRYYLAVAAALALQASAAHADTIVGLVGEDILATFDSRTAKTTALTKIDGIGPVLGVDVRPADGQLYALASDGTVAIVDPATGKTTVKSKLDTLPPEGIQVSVDFNPVADKLRIIGSDGTNLRANVDDGKVTQDQPLKFADADQAAGQTPGVVAGAYANSVKGTKETTLYDIDVAQGGLFRQAPPNDGILNSIGMTGLDVETVGFDIATDAAGNNTGMLVAKGNLYTLDLTSGKAVSGKAIAGLPSGIRDIAVLAKPIVKQAATMNVDVMTVKPTAAMTSDYLPKPTAGTMGAAMPKSTQQMKVDYSTQRSAYAAPKMKRGPQCDR